MPERPLGVESLVWRPSQRRLFGDVSPVVRSRDTSGEPLYPRVADVAVAEGSNVTSGTYGAVWSPAVGRRDQHLPDDAVRRAQRDLDRRPVDAPPPRLCPTKAPRGPGRPGARPVMSVQWSVLPDRWRPGVGFINQSGGGSPSSVDAVHADRHGRSPCEADTRWMSPSQPKTGWGSPAGSAWHAATTRPALPTPPGSADALCRPTEKKHQRPRPVRASGGGLDNVADHLDRLRHARQRHRPSS